MPELTIKVGGKDFVVACPEGEEQFLKLAAETLDREASGLVTAMGRMPESRMLLMAGLMLADKMAANEEKARVAEEKLARQDRQIEGMKSMPAPEPERIEVPVIPSSVRDSLAELAARAEALAAFAEEKAAS